MPSVSTDYATDLLDATPQPICYITWEGRILYNNDAFRETFLKDSYLTNNFIELLEATERPNVLKAMRRMCDGPSSQDMDLKDLEMATAAGLKISFDWRLRRSEDCALLMLFGR